MGKIINKFKNKYFLFSFVVVMICVICLSSYGVFVVNTNNYRSNEMYFGKLIYQISLQSKSSSATVNGKVVSLTSANATSTILMKVTSLNPVKSRYNIEYKVTSGNVSVRYSTVTGWLPQGYLDAEDNSVYEKIIKIKIINASGSAATVALDVVGGYAYNSDSDVETLSGYTKLVNGNSSSIFDDSSSSSVKVLSTRVKNDTSCTPTSSSPCIYGGEINRNYLSHSGDIYRIIGVYLINGVESVKLVKATNYSTATSYNTHQNIFQTWKNNLYLSSDYLKTSSPFCTTDTLTCSSPTFDYGLVTKKEYENMGMYYSYLNNGTNSITTTETGSNVYYIKIDGTLGTIAKTTSSSGRPVLYLKNDVKIIKTTNGTLENPYQLAPYGDLFINSIRVNNVLSSSTPTSGSYMMTSSCTCDQETCSSGTTITWDDTDHTINYALGNNSPTLVCDLNFYVKTTTTLNNQGGSPSSSTVTSTYAQAFPTVTPPTSPSCVFGGYYSAASGSGTKYINANGTSATNSTFTSPTTLYAKWTCTQTFRNNKTIITAGSFDNPASTLNWAKSVGSGSFDYNSNYNGYPAYVITSSALSKTSYIYQNIMDSYEPNTQYLVSIKAYVSSDYVAGMTNNITGAYVSGNYNNNGTSTFWGVTYDSLQSGRKFDSLPRNQWADYSITFTTPNVAKSSITSGNFRLYFRDWTGTIAFRDLTVSKYSDIQTTTSVFGSAIGTLPTVSQTGHTFNGWFTQPMGGTQITSSTTSGLATDYYAHWNVNSYNLTLNPNGGSWNGTTSNTTVTQKYQTQYNVTNNPIRAGYVFGGWKHTSGSGYLDYNSTSVYNQYIINSTSATKPNVYNNQGNGTVTHTIISDSTSSTGYSMRIVTNGTASPGAGGFINQISSSSGAVYYHKIIAKIPTTHNIELASNSRGIGSSQYWITSQAGTGDWEEYVYATYCGYNGTFSTFGHVYLYANGTGGGTNTSVTWYLRESTMYRKAANKAALDSSTSTYTYGAGNGVLTARWLASGSRITLNSNGGTNNSGMTYKDMVYYTAYTSNQTLPYTGNMAKVGYTFKGWYTATSGGTQVFNANGQLNASISGYSDSSRRWLYYTQNITLYAQWQLKPVTVAFNGAPFETISWSGGSVALNTYGKGTASIIPSSYTFTSSIGKSISSATTAFTKAVTLPPSDNTITVNMYPDGAVYWYGNGDKSGEALYSSVNGAGTGTGGITYYGAGYYPSGLGQNQIYANGMAAESGRPNNIHLSMLPHNVGSTWSVFHCNYKITKAIYKGTRTNIIVRYKIMQMFPKLNVNRYTDSFDVINTWTTNYTRNGTFAVPENANGDNLQGTVSLSGAASSFHFNLHMRATYGEADPTERKQWMLIYAIWMT